MIENILSNADSNREAQRMAMLPFNAQKDHIYQLARDKNAHLPDGGQMAADDVYEEIIEKAAELKQKYPDTHQHYASWASISGSSFPRVAAEDFRVDFEGEDSVKIFLDTMQKNLEQS